MNLRRNWVITNKYTLLFLLLVFLFVPQSKSQTSFNKSRVEYITLVALNVDAQTLQIETHFRIGVLDKSVSFFNELVKSSKIKKIHSKEIEFVHFTNEIQISEVEILYISPNFTWNVNKIELMLNNRTLVITENQPFDKTIIGFFQVNNSLRIEVNEKKLSEISLKLTNEFIKITFRNADQWKNICKLYEQMIANYSDTLTRYKGSTRSLLKEIEKYKKENSELTKLIASLEVSIRNQNDSNQLQKGKLDELNKAIELKKREMKDLLDVIYDQISDVNVQEKSIITQRKQIKIQETRLFEQQIQFAEMEEQIIEQSKILETKNRQILKQKATLVLYTILFVTVVLITIFIFGSLRMKKKANEQLAEKNMAINKQKEEIEMAKREAELANEAKSIFLANMSHEIRTPMNAILGFTNILSEIISDQKQKHYLDAIKTGGKNLLTLINDILDLSKIEAGKLELNYEPVKPEKIVDELEKIFALKINEKGLKFSVNIHQNVPDSILLDEIRLRQILLNLIGNAVKFTEEGEISIDVEAVETGESEDGKIKLYDISFSVSDTGIGIAQSDVNEIFKAFKQQDGQSTKKYGGTGLGLAISRRLVEMMNGTISVESKLGVGSKFTVIFHHVSNVIMSASAYIANQQISNDIIFDSAKVLIVDDIQHNRDLLKAFLQNGQPKLIVFEAQNGFEAIQQCNLVKPDLILMDILMPGMDGVEAFKKIRNEQYMQMPIIAVTASAMKNEKAKLIQYNFDGILLKPLRKQDLFNEMARFLPYSKPSSTASTENEIPQKKPEIHLELLSELDEKFMVQWYEISKTNRIKDNKQFGVDLHTLGLKYNSLYISEYGSEIQTAAECFDIENLTKLLKSFPEMLANLKKKYNETAKIE